MSEINILVLGGKGTGKTCFMLGMYDDMRIGYGGFTFSATDVDVDRKLVDNFRKLTDSKGEDRWPLPNEGITEYEFNLNFALRRFMVFGWHDYRGGIISEAGEFYDEVRTLAEKADVIMICAPGNDVYAGAIRRDRKALQTLLVAEVQQLLEKDSQIKPPVVILVTKADLFAAGCRKDNPKIDEQECGELLIEQIKRLYQTLFVKHGGWRVMICPVTLGAELATNPESGMIAPTNMHLPVMYAYHEYAKNLADSWRARINVKKEELSALRQKWFAKNRTREALRDLATLEMHNKAVQEKISVVHEHLRSAPFFFGGQPTALD